MGGGLMQVVHICRMIWGCVNGFRRDMTDKEMYALAKHLTKHNKKQRKVTGKPLWDD